MNTRKSLKLKLFDIIRKERNSLKELQTPNNRFVTEVYMGLLSHLELSTEYFLWEKRQNTHRVHHRRNKYDNR